MQADLVVRAQRGDREAFEILAAWATPRLLAVARGVLRDPDDADDALQRALLGMWRGLPALRDPERFDAWSYRLVVNACHAELRSRDPRRVVGSEGLERTESVDDRSDAVADRERLDRALASLSPIHRATVMLHVVLDLTQEDTARILGVPLGTVHSRVARAMDVLRGALTLDERRIADTLGPDGPGDLDPPPDAWSADMVGPASLGRFGGRRIVVAIDGTGDHATIGAAVAAARDGDVVVVRPGVYAESTTVTRDIAIVGDGPPGSVCIDVRGSVERQAIRIGWEALLQVPVAYAFHLVRTRALLADLAIHAPEAAVAVIVDGGAPELHRLDVQLDGRWAHTIGHQFALFRGDAAGRITGCRATGNILVTEGSAPMIQGNHLSGALTVRDQGTAPTIRDNRMVVRGRAPWCLGIIRGASPLVEHNDLTWASGSAIGVFSAETRPTIRENRISGSRIGIQTWDGSTPTIEHNDISGNTVGVSVCWATPELQANRVARNQATALLVLGGSPPRFEGNRLHANGSGHVRPVGMRLTGPVALRMATERT